MLLQLLALLFFIKLSSAQQMPKLQNMDETQFRNFSQTFAAAFMFKPVEPASNYDVEIEHGAVQKFRGWSAGFSVGEVTTLKIREFYEGTFPVLPFAMGVVTVAFPWGLAAEAGGWPRIALGGFAFEDYGLGFKWTFTDVLWDKNRYFHVALRGNYTSAGVEFNQEISGASIGIGYNTQVYTANVSISRKFGFAEPYLGVGFLRQTSTLTYSGSVPAFNRSVTLNNSATITSHHQVLFGGLQIQTLVFALTLEYFDVGGVNGYVGKLGLRY